MDADYYINTIFILTLLIALFAVAFIVIHIVNAKRRADSQQILENKLSKMFEGSSLFRVRRASEKYFQKKLPFFLWEDYGVLVLGEKQLIYSTEKTTTRFALDEIIIYKLENTPVTKSMLSWIIIENNGKHYFTSETGFQGLESKKTTDYIFSQITQWLQKHKRT